MSEKPAAGPNGESPAQSTSPTTDRIAVMAHETIDRVAETANHAENGMRDATATTSDAAKSAGREASALASEGLQRLRSYAEENPLTSAGIAFAAGVLLSALVRR
jgi:ElaB/YqjD/DUF883 family membrane-anchored ribosome-binding protein